MLPQNSDWCTLCIILSFEISTTLLLLQWVKWSQIMVELHYGIILEVSTIVLALAEIMCI